MATNDIGKKESKKEKNIKHGVIALACLAVTILLIITGIYLWG